MMQRNVIPVNTLKDTYVRSVIKQKVKSMLLNKVHPTIQLVANYPCLDEIVTIQDNYKNKQFFIFNEKVSYDGKNSEINDLTEYFYLDAVQCVDSYPGEYIYLVGYSYNDHTKEDYISEIQLLNNPYGKTTFEIEAESYL